MKYLARFALWLATKCGAVFAERPRDDYIVTAHEFVAHCDAQNEPWEWKQRQALRAMRQRYPKAKIRDLNLAIEIAVQERACLVSHQ